MGFLIYITTKYQADTVQFFYDPKFITTFIIL